MEFFVPFATDAQQSERVLTSLCEYHEYPVPEKRVQSIHYRFGGAEWTAEVGKTFSQGGRKKEPVLAILPGKSYCICTPARGGLNSAEPMYIPAEGIISVQHFT